MKPKTLTVVNWLDLPRDLVIKMFTKLGTIDLLCGAQPVCSSWRDIAEDPQFYRVVDFYNPWDRFGVNDDVSVENAAKLAVARSRGRLVEFSIEYFCTDEILQQVADKAPQLKRLRIADCYDGIEDCLIEVIGKLPLLEEVEFIFPTIGVEVLEAVGRSCPKLKSFRLNCKRVNLPFRDLFGAESSDDEPDWFNDLAFAIAGNMNPGLKSLHLLGNSMDNDGLKALLERFTQLEYLDLRRCDELHWEGDLLNKCRGIKTLRLPDDSTEDIEVRVGKVLDGSGDMKCQSQSQWVDWDDWDDD